ncbi:ABC-type Co2+ transport system, permease component [Panicum miliaceum]|uniref:ABC-type Co2+ transport system, permease component n=1 Tax=Panicum miliaceum TaxID=4540 RepID=A0A3L6SDC7_PANMI|nr:ABC-type Co2+ transport system, permease component [Panicum miliaceum]
MARTNVPELANARLTAAFSLQGGPALVGMRYFPWTPPFVHTGYFLWARPMCYPDDQKSISSTHTTRSTRHHSLKAIRAIHHRRDHALKHHTTRELVVVHNGVNMAALLHQAALPAAKSPHPRALNPPTPSLSLSPLSRRRRGARTVRSAATDSSIGAGAAPSERKATRKEQQQERRRQQDLQHRQQQLLMMEEASLAKPDGSGRSTDKNGGGGGDDDELPQPVFDRILRRIMFAVGVPMASGVALLNAYDALKRGQGVDVPAWVPLLTILVAFGTSALGIAYGTLSASWDPDKEGSLLGIDEARANWPVLWKEEIDKEKAKAKQRKK